MAMLVGKGGGGAGHSSSHSHAHGKSHPTSSSAQGARTIKKKNTSRRWMAILLSFGFLLTCLYFFKHRRT